MRLTKADYEDDVRPLKLKSKFSFNWMVATLWGMAVLMGLLRVLSWIEGTRVQNWLEDFIIWIKERRSKCQK